MSLLDTAAAITLAIVLLVIAGVVCLTAYETRDK